MNCRVCNEVYSVKELEAVVEKWHAGEQSYATDQCTHTLEGDDYIFAPACPNHLSLLVIDLWSSCVVKVEKGRATDVWCALDLSDRDETSTVLLTNRTFQQIQDSLTSLDVLAPKPVPRIERTQNKDEGGYPYLLIGERNDRTFLRQEGFDAIYKLAGRAPIYEQSKQGTWRKLSKTYDEQVDDVPLTVWRYTR
jgi:hypothetical protein